MVVLVTGATGLCGNAIMKQLNKEGILSIGYSRKKPDNPIKGCIYEQGDLSSLASIIRVMTKHNVTHVIHGGGISHPLINTNDPWSIVQTNITGTINMLDAAKLLNIQRFIYLSSGAVYGNSKKERMLETDACFPTSIYGVTKLASEGLCRVYKERFGLQTVSLRLCYIYGPGRYQPDAMRDLLVSAIRGEDILWDKGGGQVLEYLNVEDCARAIILALKNKALPYNEVNIGSGQNTSIKEVAKTITRLFPKCKIEIKDGTMGYDLLGPFDCTRAKKWLNFTPQISLEEGIKTYAEWLKQHLY